MVLCHTCSLNISTEISVLLTTLTLVEYSELIKRFLKKFPY